MMNLGDKSMMLLAAVALGVCPCAALATYPEPLSVDSVAIADLEQFAACYQEWNDCFIEMNNLAAGSIKCKCIYKCGPSLLSAPMLQVP